MSINKYFFTLPTKQQYDILDVCKKDTTTDNKVLYIYYILYPNDIDIIHTDKRLERICHYILRYADRLNYYLTTGRSIGQYYRELDKKLGLL